MDDPEHKRAELLQAVYKLSALLEQASGMPDVYQYIAVLNQLRDKLVARGCHSAGGDACMPGQKSE